MPDYQSFFVIYIISIIEDNPCHSLSFSLPNYLFLVLFQLLIMCSSKRRITCQFPPFQTLPCLSVITAYLHQVIVWSVHSLQEVLMCPFSYEKYLEERLLFLVSAARVQNIIFTVKDGIGSWILIVTKQHNSLYLSNN